MAYAAPTGNYTYSAEYEAGCDKAELMGFDAGIKGEKRNTVGLFGDYKTYYYRGYKAGQALAAK